MLFTTDNNDTGSLKLAPSDSSSPQAGDEVRLAREAAPRRVSFVMGRHVCTKGHGAFPVGRVEYEWVTGPSNLAAPRQSVAANRAPTTLRSGSLSLPTLDDAAAPPDRAVWTGFDSAWGDRNEGGLAHLGASGGKLHFEGAVRATFASCAAHASKLAPIAPLHVLFIDQPIVVANARGKRPVEAAVSHMIGRAGGGVQPANVHRPFFSENAPVWKFLSDLGDLGYRQETDASRRATEGRFYLETFPALTTLGLFGYARAPKYNPERKTFQYSDWKLLCSDVRDLAEHLAISNLPEWAEAIGAMSPRKGDQDCLDAVICMLTSFLWWRGGLTTCTTLGDAKTGYMVIPCFEPRFRQCLLQDARSHDVKCDVLF